MRRKYEMKGSVAWGEDDLFFLKRYARRLARDFPDATLEFVPNCRAFVPEDRPERLAELIESLFLSRAGATSRLGTVGEGQTAGLRPRTWIAREGYRRPDGGKDTNMSVPLSGKEIGVPRTRYGA